MNKTKEPKRDKLTVIGTIVLILMGTMVLLAFVLMMLNIYNAICHG